MSAKRKLYLIDVKRVTDEQLERVVKELNEPSPEESEEDEEDPFSLENQFAEEANDLEKLSRLFKNWMRGQR